MSIRIIVSGHVQGVGYRAWAVRTAKGLGLTGWVRNRHDGTVEILADGAQTALDRFVIECRQGPAYAQVDDVKSEVTPDDAGQGFSERPSV